MIRRIRLFIPPCARQGATERDAKIEEAYLQELGRQIYHDSATGGRCHSELSCLFKSMLHFCALRPYILPLSIAKASLFSLAWCSLRSLSRLARLVSILANLFILLIAVIQSIVAFLFAET